MSYAICRVQKIKGASSVHGVQGHQRRERESNTNPDIDYARVNMNYSLLDENMNITKSFNALADERIKQGYTGTKSIRKDAVKVVSALFTSDNDFFQDKQPYEQRKFFEDCLAWASEKFGKANIFSAIVHMDEETPHLHIEFVPLTADGRLSAKAVLGGRVDLQRMQDDFYQTVCKPWGLQRGERADLENPTAKRPRKHLETAELKQKTAAEVMALVAERDRLHAENIKMTAENACLHKLMTDKKEKLEREINELQVQKADIECNIDKTHSDFNALKSDIDTQRQKLALRQIEWVNGDFFPALHPPPLADSQSL